MDRTHYAKLRHAVALLILNGAATSDFAVNLAGVLILVPGQPWHAAWQAASAGLLPAAVYQASEVRPDSAATLLWQHAEASDPAPSAVLSVHQRVSADQTQSPEASL